jgi:hypothetical protein
MCGLDCLQVGEPSISLKYTRMKVIACSMVINEILPHLPHGVESCVLDFVMHLTPSKLRKSLQRTVDTTTEKTTTILLGYGLCSQAVVGLRANNCTLVIPKVDDCIALLLGSEQSYRAQFKAEPGTYYLTKRWIESGENLFNEYRFLEERYGEQRARSLMCSFLKHYTRLALINTGQLELDSCREYCRQAARHFGLRYEEIQGSTALIKKLVNGPHDDDFVVIPPGGVVSYMDFK